MKHQELTQHKHYQILIETPQDAELIKMFPPLPTDRNVEVIYV